jgi:hypothetical protein
VGASNNIRWLGKQVSKKVHSATAAAMNETLADAVAEGKNNHPGWENRTGTAEGSIRVQQAASSAALVGQWGSVGVNYFSILEFWHGHALTMAAQRVYPTLTPRIRRRL